MFEIVSLAPYGFYGGDVGNLLLQLDQLGVFSYLLPFLIIFSLIFGILTRMNIFKDNKAINAIIALSVGLMSLQFGFVSNFFSEVFPRLGVALAVILVILILLGLFIDSKERWPTYVLLFISFLAVIFVLLESATFSGTSFGYLARDYAKIIIVVLVIGGLLAAVIGYDKNSPKSEGHSLLERALRGE